MGLQCSLPGGGLRGLPTQGAAAAQLQEGVEDQARSKRVAHKGEGAAAVGPTHEQVCQALPCLLRAVQADSPGMINEGGEAQQHQGRGRSRHQPCIEPVCQRPLGRLLHPAGTA